MLSARHAFLAGRRTTVFLTRRATARSNRLQQEFSDRNPREPRDDNCRRKGRVRAQLRVGGRGARIRSRASRLDSRLPVLRLQSFKFWRAPSVAFFNGLLVSCRWRAWGALDDYIGPITSAEFSVSRPDVVTTEGRKDDLEEAELRASLRTLLEPRGKRWRLTRFQPTAAGATMGSRCPPRGPLSGGVG